MSTIETVIDVLAATAPEIRANLIGRRGTTNAENPTGDTQVEADVMADELLVDRLTKIDGVGQIATEERETPVDCGDGLTVALDPLDGSSNLASNNPMGTIAGIYEEPVPASGESLVAAASMLFGPITTITVAKGETATEYEVVDGIRREATEELTLPTEPTVYGFGGGDSAWTPAFAEFAETIRQELKLRYGGAFVADVNQVLEYGGLFAYPALQNYPNGKLRYHFEAAPMAYILRAAGGAASDGTGAILDRTPTALHERCPVYLGNTTLVKRVEDALAVESA